MKLFQKIIVALVFIGIIALELTLAQEQTEEIAQEDKINLSQQKKVEGGKKSNPFLLPPGVYLLSKGGSPSGHKEGATKPDTKSQEIDPLGVKAILISDHIRLATIGRHTLTLGDMINDEKILEIKTDRVILGKEGKKRTLLLHQSPVKLTTEEK